MRLGFRHCKNPGKISDYFGISFTLATVTASNPIPIVKELTELYHVRRKKQFKIALYPRPERRGFTDSLDKAEHGNDRCSLFLNFWSYHSFTTPEPPKTFLRQELLVKLYRLKKRKSSEISISTDSEDGKRITRVEDPVKFKLHTYVEFVDQPVKSHTRYSEITRRFGHIVVVQLQAVLDYLKLRLVPCLIK